MEYEPGRALKEQLQGSLSCEPACGGSNGHESRATGGEVLSSLVGIFSPLSIRAYFIPRSPR